MSESESGAPDRFLAAIAAEDLAAAHGVGRELIAEGPARIRVLLDDLIPKAQRQVGERWQHGEWTVAQEHRATDLMLRLVDEALETVRSREAKGTVLLTCAEGEWHALTTRILGVALEAGGWRPLHVAPSLTASQLLSAIYDLGPSAVAISCSMPGNLVGAHRMILTAHETHTPAVVGGGAFGADGVRAGALGADGWAASAWELAGVLDGVTASSHTAPQPAEPPEEYWALLRDQQTIIAALGAFFARTDGIDGDLAAGGVLALRALLASLLLDDEAILADQFVWQQHRAELGNALPVAAISQALTEALPPEHVSAREFIRLAGVEAGLGV